MSRGISHEPTIDTTELTRYCLCADQPAHIEGRYKKYSTTSSIYSKKALSQHTDHIESLVNIRKPAHSVVPRSAGALTAPSCRCRSRSAIGCRCAHYLCAYRLHACYINRVEKVLEGSWWYACCAKCHQEDSGVPSWEPPNWQKICPYPLCPSYRQFAQNLSVFLIGILTWITVWVVLGDTAAPGGQMFTLVVLTLAAYFGGWLLMKTTTLPALIGMLIVGIILKNVGFVNFDETYQRVASYIRKIALTIILTRAGLDLEPQAMKKYFVTVIKLALVPWTYEFLLSSVMGYFLLGLPWSWALLMGSIIAAVSPAVIVPCLFRLRSKGYGVAKGIPTLVLAVSGVDDAASVAVFGIVSSLMFAPSSMTMNIIQGPASIIGGIAFGVVCGYLLKYVPERNDAFMVPLRVLLLLVGGLFAVLGSEEIGWGGAGPLAVIAFAFVACKNWTEQGWELEDNPVATAFEIFWMFFEPMLFSVTGAQVVIKDLEPHLVLVGGGILIACVISRAMLTSACAVRSNLNTKEKVFVGLAWMAKATVQAALGPVALDEVRKMGGEDGPPSELLQYAETVITVCIMSIVITAPLGAIVITLTGPRLLTKTTKPPVLEGKSKS
ncbi:hypothetical protein EVAR_46468_1 [Eumeta japonica]|uniref:Cation/H+ exchanger transmembrane domain-containing protein n=1 Tax=Eumeta variegata TaxID=151549 RepID=A0A4C1XJZ5_EUMVA|nr:hypothetical protein EVAR_46468_1 [Eumeta japonica]